LRRVPAGARGAGGAGPRTADRRRRAGERLRAGLPRDRRADPGPGTRGRTPPGAAAQRAVVAGSSRGAASPRSDSSRTIATPTVIAESATLNIGQLQAP